MKSYEAGARNWEGEYGFVLEVTEFGDAPGAVGDIVSSMEEMCSAGGWSVAENPRGTYGSEGTFIAAQADPLPDTDGTAVRVMVHVEMSGRRFDGDPEPDVLAMARQAAASTARATQKRLRYRYPEARVRTGDAFLSQQRPSWAHG